MKHSENDKEGVKLLDPNGPVVVAIGGGHGLSRTLGAVRRYASRVTAVVSVADDGGSSGRLRAALGIPAPGDLRRCLSALLPGPSPLGNALEHRFESGELDGHAFGNLLLAALTESCGDFVTAIEEASRLLGTVGTVLPATSEPVTLHATAHGEDLAGQVRIKSTSGLSRVTLEPKGVKAPKTVLSAVEQADQIVVGPGSLFTSVLAALAPIGMTKAIASARGIKVFVCNLRDQELETKGFDVARHIEVLIDHGFRPDVVLCDTTLMPLGSPQEPIKIHSTELSRHGAAVHDEALLASALSKLVRCDERE